MLEGRRQKSDIGDHSVLHPLQPGRTDALIKILEKANSNQLIEIANRVKL